MLSHTYTHTYTRTHIPHTLTLEQETNFSINQPLMKMFFFSLFFFFFLPKIHQLCFYHTSQQTLENNLRVMDAHRSPWQPNFTKPRLLAGVSFPPYTTCSRTQIQTQDTANTCVHIYTNRSGPSNTGEGGSLTIYNASFLYMPRIKLF